MSFIVQLEKPKVTNNNDGVFKALPTGDYQAMVTETKITTTKTNRPMLTIGFKLVGEKRVQGAMLDGRKEFYRILLDSDKTGKILNDALYALGYKIEGAVDVNKMVEMNVLIGKMTYVHLIESSYQAKDGSTKPTNEIKWLTKQPKFFTPNGEEFSTITDDEIPF